MRNYLSWKTFKKENIIDAGISFPSKFKRICQEDNIR